MRSNFFSFFMKSKLLIMIWSPDQPFFMRSKFKKSIIRQFRSHDRSVDLLINIIVSFDLMKKENFDLMIDNSTSWKSWILISWNSTSWSFPKNQFCAVFRTIRPFLAVSPLLLNKLERGFLISNQICFIRAYLYTPVRIEKWMILKDFFNFS